jgi:hypothetical protein
MASNSAWTAGNGYALEGVRVLLGKLATYVEQQGIRVMRPETACGAPAGLLISRTGTDVVKGVTKIVPAQMFSPD